MATATAAKKSTARRTTTRKASTTRTRARRPVVPMTPPVKAAAMAAMATFESALGEANGFEGASTRNGKNGTLAKIVKLDGHRAVIRISYR